MGIAEANPQWAVGFEDECWWSRVALPTLNAWSADGEPLRLVQRSVAKDDSTKLEGHKLLRALCARDRRDVAEIRGRKTGKLHNDAVPLVVHREAPSSGKEVPASRLGQRLLAHLQRAQKVAAGNTTAASKRAAVG